MPALKNKSQYYPTGVKESNKYANLLQDANERLVGQPDALRQVVPFIQIHEAGLASADRPIGVFLLMGPTGVGKTHTCEVLAELLHGDQTRLLRVDCAEYGNGHEVAKLVGAPPGYLGHRETPALFNPSRINGLTSDKSKISIIVLDEIEKAHPSFHQILLGIFDKGTLRIGDGQQVNFTNALIFMTSNLGARAMQQTDNNMGFTRFENDATKRERFGALASKKAFSPEFLNRIDATITYQPLSVRNLHDILGHMVAELGLRINVVRGADAFMVKLQDSARDHLIAQCQSELYGARELRRLIHKHVTQQVAKLMVEGQVPAGCTLHIAHHAKFPGQLRVYQRD